MLGTVQAISQITVEMNNTYYVALSEETTRGTGVTSSPEFLAVNNVAYPSPQFVQEAINVARGNDSLLGAQLERRYEESFAHTLDILGFTESGTNKGGPYRVFKHLFGNAVTAQTGATGQYNHFFYPSSNVYDGVSSLLGDNAISLNLCVSEGAVVKLHPFVGARPVSMNITQSINQLAMLQTVFNGFRRGTVDTAIASPVMPAEGLRMSYENLKIYTGTITPTGSAGAYTTYDFSGATQIPAVTGSVNINSNRVDERRLDGTLYKGRTIHGEWMVEASIEIDWEDPSSGFSSVDELSNWISGVSERELLFVWDTGTIAGTSGAANHGMMVHVPKAVIKGGIPSFDPTRDAKTTFNYSGLYDSTDLYKVGVVLHNSYSAA